VYTNLHFNYIKSFDMQDNHVGDSPIVRRDVRGIVNFFFPGTFLIFFLLKSQPTAHFLIVNCTLLLKLIIKMDRKLIICFVLSIFLRGLEAHSQMACADWNVSHCCTFHWRQKAIITNSLCKQFLSLLLL
jgi:hypothetical protein